MLYYADGEHALDTARAIDHVLLILDDAATSWEARGCRGLPRTYPNLVEASITLGELHQAVADALFPAQDGVAPETDALGLAGTLLGRCVFRSRELMSGARPGRRSPSLRDLLDAGRDAVSQLGLLPLPRSLAARIPEGYAFYSLYPEMYFESLRRLAADARPAERYFVIGVRSIGTSLGALVSGALEEMGNDVRSGTVRPRGHPFDRFVAMSPDLRMRVLERRDSVFVVVDEGPGLTCASLLSVCAALEGVGIPAERVAILSAWRGAPSIYASDDLKARWQAQRVYHTSASDAFQAWRGLVPFVEQAIGMDPEQNPSVRPGYMWEIEDLSYGRWRSIAYPSPREWPTVHRPAERTKLLFTFDGATSSGPIPPRLFGKFAGLGGYGREKAKRAELLAEAGFGPPVAGLAYGFILYRFLEGRPLSRDDLSPALIGRMAGYYAYVESTFRGSPAPRFERLAEMIRVNSEAAVGVDATDFLNRWSRHGAEIDRLPLASLDGRPFPHEWIAVEGRPGARYLKTDGADHSVDHTIVGEQSILWDLAGCCEEWEMAPEQRLALVGEWARLSGSDAPARYLDFFRAAYLAFRTAALHYAIHGTDEEDVRLALQHQQFATNRRLVAVLLDGVPGAEAGGPAGSGNREMECS